MYNIVTKLIINIKLAIMLFVFAVPMLCYFLRSGVFSSPLSGGRFSRVLLFFDTMQ